MLTQKLTESIGFNCMIKVLSGCVHTCVYAYIHVCGHICMRIYISQQLTHINHGTLTINARDEPFSSSALENDAGYFDYYTKI